jgi:hypothetical protein
VYVALISVNVPSFAAALEIPKPNTVPHRKSSIFEPGVNSKLSPQPLLHMPPAGDMHLSVDD